MTTDTLAPTTRPATAADGAFLRALFLASLPTAMARFAGVPGLLDLQHVAREQAYAAAYPSRRDLVVLVDGQPVGRLLTAHGTGGTHVVDLAVAADHRRRGLATALLDDLLTDGPVTLSVAVDNPARGLYERLGFTATSTTDTDLSLHHPGHGPATAITEGTGS